MDDQQDQQIQEAEVIEEGQEEVSSPAPTAEENQATVLLSLEEMIKKYISRLDQLKVEVKKHKEMYDDAFLSNPTYIENTEKAKTAAKDLLTTKKNIAISPSLTKCPNVVLALKLPTLIFSIE